jgi:peptidyl-prolyl cis-trans isomerase D
MLQKIHDKASGWIAYILLGLLAVVFTFWGIDFGFNSVSYAAKVKVDSRPWWQPADKVDVGQVRQAWQNQATQLQQMYRGELPGDLKAQLQNRLLADFVRNELLTQHSHDMGYRVSDADVVRSITEIPAFQIDGRFSRDTYLYRLQVQGMSAAQFEAEQAKFLQVDQLQQSIARTAFVTPMELERNWRLQNEQREASWLVLPAAGFADGVKLDDAAIQEYYEQYQDRYMTPETVALRYVELQLDEVAAEVDVNEDDLRAWYENARDRYLDEEGNEKSFEAARAEVEADYRLQEAEKRFGELQERLADEAFENLTDLDAVAQSLGLEIREVATFSRDSGGGALGARPEVIEAAFSEHVLGGENSRPMELEPGHVVVLRVSAHRPAEPRPLADVRASIIETLTVERSEREARELAERSVTLMNAGNETLERLAAEFKAEPEGPQFIGRTDEAMPIELRNALFDTPPPVSGEVRYRAVVMGNGDAAVLKFSAVRVADVAETPEQLATRTTQLRELQAQAEFAAYLGQLEREARIVRNLKVFE